MRGRQTFPPPDARYSPVTEPLAKVGSRLQAEGTAQYTEDVPIHVGALYAAFVTSAHANRGVLGVDPGPALRMGGVSRFVGPRDFPPGGMNVGVWTGSMARALVGQQPCFAEGHAEFVGQPLVRAPKVILRLFLALGFAYPLFYSLQSCQRYPTQLQDS